MSEAIFQRKKTNDVQLQLEVSPQNDFMLRSMAAELEASSLGEVIRRAVMALDMFNVTVSKPKEITASEGKRTVRMHVRVSKKTKEKIEDLRNDYGISTVDVLNLALSTLYKLMQLRGEFGLDIPAERGRKPSLMMAAVA